MKTKANLLMKKTLLQAIVFATLSAVFSAEDKHGIESVSGTEPEQTVSRNSSPPFIESFKKENRNATAFCNVITVKHGNFLVLRDASLYVTFYKKIFSPSSYEIIENTAFLCLNKSTNSSFGNTSDAFDTMLNCETWPYEPGEYRILKNGSVAIGNEIYSGRMKFFDEVLYTCYDDHGEEYNITIDKLSVGNRSRSSGETDSMTLVYVGNTGCVLSVAAITAYLIIFLLIKELRTPPGYNLTSLNVTLFLGYLFFLIGQHPQVVETSCVICAVFSQYFFLAAFLWMNCLSFDLWRTLWCAIRKLQVSSRQRKIKKFIIYSFYSWGIAFILIAAAVIVDNHPDTPHNMRPAFGMNGICMLNGIEAKKIFFAIPGGTLSVVNALFFCHSTYLVLGNSMKDDDNNQTTAKRNFLLYVRLGVIMGITWLVGIIAIFDSSEATSMVFNVLNSTQGLLMFLLFISSRKTWQQIKGRVKRKSLLPFLKNTSSDDCECTSSEKDSRGIKETAICEHRRKESNAA